MDNSKQRLLIANDEDSIRELLAGYHHFTSNYYEVTYAGNFNEVKRAIEETTGHFDVALIDEVLEGGLEILKYIKLNHPDIQIILFTERRELKSEEIREVGAYNYISKPLNPTELAQMVNNAAERKRIHREREYLSALVSISREFTRTTDLEKQMMLVWNYVREHLGTPTFFIALYDLESDVLHFHQSYDEGKPDYLEDRFLGSDASNWGVAGYVVKTGKEQIWLNRDQANMEWQRLGIFPHITGEGPSESGICLPLQVEEKILGVLSIQSYEPDAYDQVFLNTVRALASHIAPAIVNARLIQEITQKNNEVAITRDHLERVISSSFDGIVSNDVNGKITGFNIRAEQILGYTANEIIGRPIRDLYGDQLEVERISDQLRQSEDGKLIDVAASAKSKQGDKIPIRLSITRIYDNQGNRIGSVGYFRDIRQIRETEMQRQRLLEASDAIADATNLEEGLQSLSRIMTESCVATFCSILLLTPDEQSLIVKAAYPYPRNNRLMWEPGINKLCVPFVESWASELVLSNKPIVLRMGQGGYDVVSAHLTKENGLSGAVQSVLIVPLQSDKKRLGVCILGEMRTWDRNPITKEKIEIAHSLANQAATFIEKMRLYELAKEKAEILEALENLSLTISSSLELRDILARTSQVAVELFKVNHSGLVLFDPDYVKGAVVAEFPGEFNTLHVDIPLRGVLIEEMLIERREPIVIYDVEKETDLGPVREIIYGQFNIHSTVFVPVVSKGNLLGSFSLDMIGRKRHFTKDEIDLCKMFASHVASAIENANLHLKTEKNNQLLMTLDEASRHIRAENEPARLLHEIVRLATELMKCESGCLFAYHSSVKEMEIVATYGLREKLNNRRIPLNDGITGYVARTGESVVTNDYFAWNEHEVVFEPFNMESVLCVPLNQGGEVIAMLLLANRFDKRVYDESDLDLLERFAAQASIALHTSGLINKEQRRFDQLNILHQISDYIQEVKDLDSVFNVVLTGVTAGYGLGFNRAALLLLDEMEGVLIGRMGVGHHNREAAWKDWENHLRLGLNDFGHYLADLEKGKLYQTPVDKKIRELQLSVKNINIFSRVVQEKRSKLIPQEKLQILPDSFLRAFEPDTPLIIAPIVVRDKVLGVLVADNKFTQAPITTEDIDLLITFVNTAALAISNVQLIQEARSAREKIRSSFEASNNFILSQPSKQLLKDVIAQIQKDAWASWVSIVLVDQTGYARNYFTTGEDNEADISDVIRPDGITMQVIRTGKAEFISNTELERHRVNPRMFQNKVGAALCLPFSMRGKRIGVMWIHYDSPRTFPEYEIEAIELYVNQAAIAYDSARRMEELGQIQKAVEALSGSATLEDVLRQIVQSAKNVLEADSVAIRSFNSQLNDFVPEGSVMINIPEDVWEKILKEEPHKEGTAYKIMDRGWLGVVDTQDGDRYPHIGEQTREILRELHARSFQGVALSVGDEKLGVLYLNYNYRRNFGDEEQAIARTFANHVALALKKARLLDELVHALGQATRVRNTAKAVAEVTTLEDLQSTLNSIVIGTKEALGCDAVTLYTYDQERDMFGFPPAMIGITDVAKLLEIKSVAKGSTPYKVLKQDDIYVASDSRSDSLMGSPFSLREDVKSTIGVPLVAKNQKVGVLFINYRTHHNFDDEELLNVRLFSRQAAIAIRNAKLLGDIKHRNAQLKVISRISKSISTLLDLNLLIDHAVNIIRDHLGLYYVGLFLVDDKFDYAVLRGGSGEAGHNMLANKHKLKIDGASMVGWSIRNSQARIAMNVAEDGVHFKNPELPETQSEVAIPLISHKQSIGALTVQSNEKWAFTNEDITGLQTMADQLTIAIENALQYEEIKKTKDVLAARTSVAWIGMASSTWRHSIEKHATTIREQSQLLRSDIDSVQLASQVEKRLIMIERLASRILEKPITPPLSSEEGVESVLVNKFVIERIKHLKRDEPYSAVNFELDFMLDDNATVRTSPEWLRRAFDIVLDNGVKATFGLKSRKVVVVTSERSNKIEINIMDNGYGIAEDILPDLFRKPVKSGGLGMGLLFAQMIIQTYGGLIFVKSTGSNGTTVTIELPIEAI